MEIKITKTTKPAAKPDQNNLGFGKIFTDHMFVMNYTEGQGWHDARIVPFEKISLSPAAMVFHYGQEVLESIRIAKSRGASIICMTAVSGSSVAKESQEVIQVAALKNLDTGTKISPQFSILAIMDVLYSYYFANDSYFKTQKYKATLSAIRAKGEHTEDKDE